MLPAKAGIYEDIANACPRDTKLFHRLIRKQRVTASSPGTELVIDSRLISGIDDVIEAWTTHFNHLATPQNASCFDEKHKQLVEDLLVMQWCATNTQQTHIEISQREVRQALRSLNNGKAADIHGLKAEHIKTAEQILIPSLTELFNILLKCNRTIEPLNSAFILPVHKKGKDRLCTDNYRGITITPILAKLMEHILLARIESSLQQSSLQFGFTKKLSPTMAILAVTEAIADATDRRAPLYVIALDVRKAFDVVDHSSLLRKLYHQTDSPTWRYIHRNLKTSARVRLGGSYGRPFDVNQGVGQGKIMSTHNYKLYVNNLLLQLTNIQSGAKIGETFIGAPTCADDIILMAADLVELQTQIDIVSDYADRERYHIHPDKSKCIVYGVNNPSPAILNDKVIPIVSHLTHLGIDRYSGVPCHDQLIDSRLSLARRTAYSLMGTGFHGVNGISPSYTINIYRTYVLPRLTFGLEAVVLKEKQIQSLESYHRTTLRELQSLPKRTAKCAVYLLAGTLPLEGLLDIQIASLLHMAGGQRNTILFEIGMYQLSTKNTKSTSWFIYAARRLARYNLDATVILERTGLLSFKTIITNYWTNHMREEIATKSSLRYLRPESCDLKKPHRVWSSGGNTTETRKATQKARLLTGTYTLQSNKATFNQFAIDATCPLCGEAPEDRQHFILNCSTLHVIRAKYLTEVNHLIPNFNDFDPEDKLLILLDSSYPRLRCNRADLEAVSRSYIYSLHCKRTSILNSS